MCASWTDGVLGEVSFQNAEQGTYEEKDVPRGRALAEASG